MKRGSITLQMSLALGLSLTLVLYSIQSVRIADGRVLMACALEQGLYSLFAGYDIDLYEKYGLLFLDGGYGEADFQPGKLCREVTDAAEYIVDPAKERGMLQDKTLPGVQLSGGEITGYLLATDNSGAAFRSQVKLLMEERIGTAGIQMLAAELTDTVELSGQQEQFSHETDIEGALREYEAQKEAAAAQTQPTDSRTENASFSRKLFFAQSLADRKVVSDVESQIPEVPEDFQNPIDTVQGMWDMGILSLAIPTPGNLSSYTLDDENLVSRRTLQRGMGMAAEDEAGAFDKLMMLEFLAETFPCYTSQSQEEGLKYQVEYAIGKRNSDRENLKTVLERLLLIRGASNFLYVMTSPARSAEADQMALLISMALLMPPAQPLIALVLKICWAYAESILDLRVLLDGGKIPLAKSDDSWQLSIYGLGNMLTNPQQGKSTESGLDYTWYLRMLLFAESQEELTDAAMDLTEHNIQARCGRPDFRLDSCVYAAEICLTGETDMGQIQITRSYGYDM